jgi:hypothetical protein
VVTVGVEDASTPTETVSIPGAWLVPRERKTEPEAEPNSPKREVEIDCRSARGKSQEGHRTEPDDAALMSDAPLKGGEFTRRIRDGINLLLLEHVNPLFPLRCEVIRRKDRLPAQEKTGD